MKCRYGRAINYLKILLISYRKTLNCGEILPKVIFLNKEARGDTGIITHDGECDIF